MVAVLPNPWDNSNGTGRHKTMITLFCSVKQNMLTTTKISSLYLQTCDIALLVLACVGLYFIM